MTKWIKNTGEHPVGLDNDEMVQICWSNNKTGTYPACCVFWEIDESTHCTHWRRTNNLTLDDAYDRPPKEEQNTMYKMPFDKEQWENGAKYDFPETTYEPLNKSLPQGAVIASIFNTLYPEPCVLREVHVEALKEIMKLVEERGGE